VVSTKDEDKVRVSDHMKGLIILGDPLMHTEADEGQ
jgi:hypothetical protein